MKKKNTEEIKTEYTLIRSSRRTVAIQIKDGTVILRAPRKMSSGDIERFFEAHRIWIDKHLQKSEERRARYAEIKPLTADELQELSDKATEVIPERVEHFSRLLGVSYGRITVRNQLTRWGSCSSKGNLNFNCLLMLAPPEVLDAIVAHELCHRLEMNHSKAFYERLLSVYPEYRKWHAWLKEHGGELMRRNPKVK